METIVENKSVLTQGNKTNEFFFQINVTSEQKSLAIDLVDYSITNHPVSDIYKNDVGMTKEEQRKNRFIGTLGEIVFADAYSCNRPKKSFGAIDGQDNGEDFKFIINDKPASIDVKSMGRKDNNLRENYVFNLPKYQMDKLNTITDYYYCISFHRYDKNTLIASFLGYALKQKIQNGEIGILWEKGSKRIKDDGNGFVFPRDTYEIDIKDITTPDLTDKIKKLDGFRIKYILPKYIK